MVPLLQALSLLQRVARANRITHFNPATACIVSSVRTMLSDVGCLPRDAPILKQHSMLAKERKRILSDLALLVEQTKKASEELLDEDQRESEVESMIRGSGQLFAHVRGFLAVAVQCGVNVDPRAEPASVESDRRWGSEEGTLIRSEESTPLPDDYGPYWESVGKDSDSRDRSQRQREVTATLKRARSLSAVQKGDLLHSESASSPVNQSQTRTLGRGSGKQWLGSQGKGIRDGPIPIHKPAQPSVSSISSSSSFSSGESVGTPPTPVFPSGPSTTAEVMDASTLR